MGENVYTGPVAKVPWLHVAGCAFLLVLFVVIGPLVMVPANNKTEGMQTVALVVVYLAGFIGAAVLWWCSVSRWQTSRERAWLEGAMSLDLLQHIHDVMAAQNRLGQGARRAEALSAPIFLFAVRGAMQQHTVAGLEEAARSGQLPALLGGGAPYIYEQQGANGAQQPHPAINAP